MKIGVIGAGLSGIIAARELSRRGHTVELIEKGRSVGGRLATRRIGEGQADHGAVYFTVRQDWLRQEVEQWMRAGWVREWYADPYPRYVGTDGMNGVAKQLASGLSVRLNERAESIQSTPSGVTIVTDETTSSYDVVLITAPLPQTFELLRDVELDESLRQLAYDPTFVGLFEVSEPLVIGENGLQDDELDASILKIVNNRQKGITETELISVYMDESWSAASYERDESMILDTIQRQLLAHIGPVTIKSAQLKRWRYAQATDVWHAPFYQVPSTSIYLAGDVFLEADDASGRTRFESAYLSGRHVAERIHQTTLR